jgi:uncharacterized SAM-binding protein YcdF (DUF218 family)
MFVFLSKFLPPFVYPFGFAIILLVLALVLHHYRRLQRAGIIAAVLILLIGSNRWVAFSLSRSLEWQYLPAGEIPNADAIVLLGGGTDSAEPPRPLVQVNGAGERVIYAAYLFKQGKAPTILASGGNLEFVGSKPSTPASDMEVLLTFMGVPEQAIWLEDKSQNTYENALYCAQILREKNIDRVILVTSAIHMPRSVALFQKQGIQVIPAPADFNVTQAGWDDLTHATLASQIINLLPSTGNLSLTTDALKEYLGILVYRLRGWIS